MKILIENVRSFAGRHVLPLRPLTLIVGENSSGKTTFLAMVSAIFGSDAFPLKPEFNESPYDLGSYETIATYKGGKYGRAKHFSLGYIDENHRASPEVIARYASIKGQPALDEVSVKTTDGTLVIKKDGSSFALLFSLPDQDPPYRLPLDKLPTRARFGLNFMAFSFWQAATKQKWPHKVEEALLKVARVLGDKPREAVSLAPVRTKPKRTYDPAGDVFRPEGDHVPLLLARALSSEGTGKQKDQLKTALQRFGANSGLFTSVSVRRLGKRPADPFQILVAVAGRPFNLSDVGYGVSQSLPVVVVSVLGSQAPFLLLQQPEVHLHPKAQAALGTFFTDLVGASQQRMLIETHSDFLIDRVRQEVVKRTIKPDDVGILFFHRTKGQTRSYTMSVDLDGNIVGAPPFYREFFLKEELSLLSRGSG